MFSLLDVAPLLLLQLVPNQPKIVFAGLGLSLMGTSRVS
jgi:hypothetical protein